MKTKLLVVILVLAVLLTNADNIFACGNPPPTAVLVAEPNLVYIGNSVILNGSGSYDGGSITKYEWDWTSDGIYDYNETSGSAGDGAFDGNTPHTYNDANAYTVVTLRVTDNGSLTDTDTCIVKVVRIENITTTTGYTTIQAALDDANYGDIIEVNEGTYYETVDFNGVSCTLTSTDPNDWDVVEATIIDADLSGSTVTFDSNEDSNSVLKGFTIQRAGSDGTDGGIYCGSSVSPVITRCIIKNNTKGIYCTGGSPTITDNIIKGNSSRGIDCDSYGAEPDIQNNLICNNGQGIYTWHSAEPIIKNNLIYSNESGLVIGHVGAYPVVRNNTIVNNTTYGIENRAEARRTVTNCIIWDSNDDLYNCNATYSCIQDNDTGTGNITGDANDPCFVDADSNDFHLLLTSPCMDIGRSNSDYSGEVDIDGDDRVIDVFCKGDGYVDVDMGADEYARKLFAGGSNPAAVYNHIGGGCSEEEWEKISPTDEGLGSQFAVLCLCEYNGDLYAGTMSASTSYPILMGWGKVWRYDGDSNWTQVGGPVGTVLDRQVSALVVYKENLYAGTSGGGGRLYRYDGGTTWTKVVDTTSGWSGFRSLYVGDIGGSDILYIGDFAVDRFGHYDGTSFTEDENISGSCVWDIEVYDSNLYASAYQGKLYRSSGPPDFNWAEIEDIGGNNLWELEAFQGYLYVSDGPNLQRCTDTGEGVEFDPPTNDPIFTEPDGDIISMVATENILILGTGDEAGYAVSDTGTGNVYIYDGTGVPQLVSDDVNMGDGIQALIYCE